MPFFYFVIVLITLSSLAVIISSYDLVEIGIQILEIQCFKGRVFGLFLHVSLSILNANVNSSKVKAFMNFRYNAVC